MAEINLYGVIRGRCPDCNGAVTNFEWSRGTELSQGLSSRTLPPPAGHNIECRLYRCVGCGRGALAQVLFKGESFAQARSYIVLDFYPESRERAALVAAVPSDIVAEFREAERAFEANCCRAAAGLFRSVLDKTMEANGLRATPRERLEDQINRAVDAGVITDARRVKAHTEIRVLGNDVLHERWKPIPAEDVEAAQHYAQRILEDLYDDRPNVLKKLRAEKLTPREDSGYVPPDLNETTMQISKAPRPLSRL